MKSTIEERKLRKMYVRKHQMSLIKYARKVHGEYVVNTTEECDAQYNRKVVHAVVHTSLKTGWDVLSIESIIDFLPLHCWKSENVVPLKYPQMVTLTFDSEHVKSEKCVLRADQSCYVSSVNRVPNFRQLAGRKWTDDQGFVLTQSYLEIPKEFVGCDLQAIVDALTGCPSRARWNPGTYNHLRFATQLPNGNFRFFREKGQKASFGPKETFGVCEFDSHNFSKCILVDVC